MRIGAAAAIVLVAAGPGLAQDAAPRTVAHDWRTYAFVQSKEGLVLWILDAGDIASPTPETRAFAVESFYETPRPFGGDKMTMLRVTFLVDCAAHTSARTRIEIWSNSGVMWDKPRNDPAEGYKPGSDFGGLADRACGKGFADIARTRAKTRMDEAEQRFAERRTMVASMAGNDWRHVSTQGLKPNRVAFYYDGASITPEPGDKLAVNALTVLETPSRDMTMTEYRLRLDCAAKTVARRIGSALRDPSTRLADAILPDGAAPFARDQVGLIVGPAVCAAQTPPATPGAAAGTLAATAFGGG